LFDGGIGQGAGKIGNRNQERGKYKIFSTTKGTKDTKKSGRGKRESGEWEATLE